MSILSLESVRYAYSSKYQTVEALKDVSCSFEQGLICHYRQKRQW